MVAMPRRAHFMMAASMLRFCATNPTLKLIYKTMVALRR
jgi:hypothetical protein